MEGIVATKVQSDIASARGESKDPGRFKAARDRGGDYIAGRMREDGTVDDSNEEPSSFWGVPIALAASGHSDKASRMLNWIRNNAFTAEGDVGPTPKKRENAGYAYQNAWLIEGAHRLGQFDLSQRGMDFITDFWDPESGGFYSGYGKRGADAEMDLHICSGCGRAAVYTGRHDVARGMGRFLRNLMEAQPNFPSQLYQVFSRAKGLHTTFDAENDARYVMSQGATRDQHFFNPGIAGGFLARLYMATGEEEWLDLAKRYMLFAEGAGDYLLNLPQLRQGKTGWCAALLYTLTGEEKYRVMAERIGDSIISYQAEDGSWRGTDPAPRTNLTAEMTIWLDEINQGVGA